MAKKKDSGINKKVLSGLSEGVMPERPRTMLHLRGAEAKRFMKQRPGSRVSANIRGVVQNVGMSEYNNDEPNVDLRITKITPKGKRR